MQTKDIKADGKTAYVFAQNWEWRSRRTWRDRLTKVVVLSTGKNRKYFPSGSWHERTAKDGVQIKFLNGHRKGDTEIVSPRQIRGLWDVIIPELKAEEKQKADYRQEQIDHLQVVREEIFRYLPDEVWDKEEDEDPEWACYKHGFMLELEDIGKVWNDGSFRSSSKSLNISASDLAEMLRLAYEKGQKA